MKIDSQKIAVAGGALFGGAVLMAGISYLVHRQITRGDVLQVRLVHDATPDLREKIDYLSELMKGYQQPVQTFADRGMDLNVRMFRREE